MNHQVESSQVSYGGVLYGHLSQRGTHFERSLGIQSQEHSDQASQGDNIKCSVIYSLLPNPGIRGISRLPYINIIQVTARHAQDLQHGVVTDLPEDQRSQVSEASQDSLQHVGLLYGYVGSLEHFYFQTCRLVVIR